MDIEFELSRTHLPIASLLRHAHEVPDRAALVDESTTITFGQLLPRVRQVAARLADSGVRQGDRVAVIAGNTAVYPIVTAATNYLGAIIVPVNFRLAAGEIAYILGDCQPTVIVSDPERAQAAHEASAGTSIIRWDLAELTSAAEPGGDLVSPPPAMPSLTDDQAIIYTSGTTGRPKGAVLSYSAIVSTTMRSTAAGLYRPGKEVSLVASPMFHIAAFNAMDTNFANAATSIITPSVGFDAATTLDVLEKHQVTVTFMVPSQWQQVVDEQRRSPRQIALRSFAWGASPATESLLTDLREVFPDAQSRANFGQTETASGGVSLRHEDSLRKLGSVGLPDRNFSIRVVDAQMNDVPQGEVGEIVYRGPGLLSRYWNNPVATAEAFAGGWFHSGDLVRQDAEGFVFVVDRVKDMIISGGENIYCAELENVIAWHPKVAEVAVVGRADEKWGEIPVAMIVPRAADDLPTLEEIREFCDGKLARYKLPKDVVIRDDFPRSGTGKVQKTVLRTQV